MIRTIRTLMVSALVGISVGQGATLPAASAAPESWEHPTRVTRLTATKAHVAAMRACTRGDDSWERYFACQKIHTYERYGRCLREELWVGDKVKIVRDEC